MSEIDGPTVHIAACFDKNMVVPALVLASSIQVFKHRSRKIVFHAVDVDRQLTELDKRLLECNDFEIRVHHPDMAELIRLDMSYGLFTSPSTYCRIILSAILPDLDKVVYIDSDAIVNQDICSLYDTDLEGRTIGACSDLYIWKNTLLDTDDGLIDARHLPAIDVVPQNYFNAGLILIDLDKWRSQNMSEICLGIAMTRSSELRYADQDVLNIVFSGKTTKIDPRWNVMAVSLLQDPALNAPPDLLSALKLGFLEPWIIHYAGDVKPWIANQRETSLGHMFWRASRQSPFLDRVKRLFDIALPSPSEQDRVEIASPEETKARPLVATKMWGELICTISRVVHQIEDSIGATDTFSSKILRYGERVYFYGTLPHKSPK